jgi:hypothetical protein
MNIIKLNSLFRYIKKFLSSFALVKSENSLKKLQNELKIKNEKAKELAKESEQFSLALEQSTI